MNLGRLLICVATVLSVAVLGGCRASCKDMCNVMADCATKLDPKKTTSQADKDKCVTDCEKDNTCGEKKPDALDCLAGIKCENETSLFGEVITCMGKCQVSK